MEFFVPAADSLDQSLDVFNGVVKFMKTQGFHPLSKAICKISYVHNSKKEKAEVNEITRVNNERVILILECESLFLICTPNRGVIRGEPILVGKHDMEQVEYFDSLPLK